MRSTTKVGIIKFIMGEFMSEVSAINRSTENISINLLVQQILYILNILYL